MHRAFEQTRDEREEPSIERLFVVIMSCSNKKIQIYLN